MLLLLSEIRKKLLWAWLVLATPTLLLLTIQELNGVFVGAGGTPWLWAVLNLLPGFGFLLLAAILNLNPGKHIFKPVFRIILVITAAYLLWVLLTALGMRARPETQSLVDYFRQAGFRPAAFQLVLLSIFGLLFLRRETTFVPNEKIMGDHAAKALAKAKAIQNLPRAEALELFVLAKFPELFANLNQWFAGKNPGVLNDLALLQNQFNQNREQLAVGVADPKAAQREYNRIALALLGVIEKM